MFNKALLVASALVMSFGANAEMSEQDRQQFKQQMQQIQQSGKIHVIKSPAKSMVQRPEQAVQSPFQNQIQQLEAQFLHAGFTPNAARQMAKKQVIENVVEQKDNWRSGGYAHQGLGTNVRPPGRPTSAICPG